MSQSWQKTQSLFSKLITDPPLKERYLKRPSPRYIFDLVINTMKKTGFPKGLFTPEEENGDYFMADSSHKRAFFNKLIDIMKIISKKDLDINIESIFKGSEEEKTNIFLQNFYYIATSNINKEAIIKQYLNDKKKKKIINKKIPKVNDSIGVNQIILEEKPKFINGFIIWIDNKVNSSENKSYLDYIYKHPLYKMFNLKIIPFEKLEIAFDFIIQHINYYLLS